MATLHQKSMLWRNGSRITRRRRTRPRRQRTRQPRHRTRQPPLRLPLLPVLPLQQHPQQPPRPQQTPRPPQLPSSFLQLLPPQAMIPPQRPPPPPPPPPSTAPSTTPSAAHNSRRCNPSTLYIEFDDVIRIGRYVGRCNVYFYHICGRGYHDNTNCADLATATNHHTRSQTTKSGNQKNKTTFQALSASHQFLIGDNMDRS